MTELKWVKIASNRVGAYKEKFRHEKLREDTTFHIRMLKYLLLLAFLVSKSTSLQLSHHHSPAAKSTFQLHSTSPRRAFLSAAVAATATTLTLPSISQALPEEDELIDVYFGCGCFWHVMHEFVVGEITILKVTEERNCYTWLHPLLN